MILALSFVLLPLAVFSQQVITGYSLQPFHYEIFITNYVVLTGAVLVFALFLKHPLSNRIFWSLFLIVLAWAITEIRYSTIRERERNLARDAFVPVATRLVDLHSASPERRGIVFSPDTYVAADNIGAIHHFDRSGLPILLSAHRSLLTSAKKDSFSISITAE